MTSSISQKLSLGQLHELRVAPKSEYVKSENDVEISTGFDPKEGAVRYVIVTRQDADVTSKHGVEQSSDNTQTKAPPDDETVAIQWDKSNKTLSNATKVIYVRPSNTVHVPPHTIQPTVSRATNTTTEVTVGLQIQHKANQCSSTNGQQKNESNIAPVLPQAVKIETDERIKHLSDTYKRTFNNNRLPPTATIDKAEPKSTKVPGTNFEYRTPGSNYMNKNGRIKRPMNAFMVWARDVRGRLAEAMPNATNSEISVRLGELWSRLKEHEKRYYFNEAERIKHKHRADFPDWVYTPAAAISQKSREPLPTVAQSLATLKHYSKIPAPIQPKPQLSASETSQAVKSITATSTGPMPPEQRANHHVPLTMSYAVAPRKDNLQINGSRYVTIADNRSLYPKPAVSSTTKGLLANKLTHGRIEQNLPVQVVRNATVVPQQLGARGAAQVFTARPGMTTSVADDFVPLASQFIHSRPTNLSRLLTETMDIQGMQVDLAPQLLPTSNVPFAHPASNFPDTAKPVMLHPADLMKAAPLLETRIQAASTSHVPFAIYQPPPPTSKPETQTAAVVQIKEDSERGIRVAAGTSNAAKATVSAAKYTSNAAKDTTNTEGQKEGHSSANVAAMASKSGSVSTHPTYPPVCARGRPPKRSNAHTSATVAHMVPSGTGAAQSQMVPSGTGPALTQMVPSGTGAALTQMVPSGTGAALTQMVSSGTGAAQTQMVPSGTGPALTQMVPSGTGAVQTQMVPSGTGAAQTQMVPSGTGPAPTQMVLSGTGAAQTQMVPPGTGAAQTQMVPSGTGVEQTQMVPSGTGAAQMQLGHTRTVAQTAPIPPEQIRPVGHTALPGPEQPRSMERLAPFDPVVPTRPTGQLTPSDPELPTSVVNRASVVASMDAKPTEKSDDSPLLPGGGDTKDNKDLTPDETTDSLWPFPFSEYPCNSWLEEDNHRAMFCDLLDSDDPFFYDSNCLYSDLYPGGLHLDVPSWENYLNQTDGTDEDPGFCFQSEFVDDINVSPVPLKETLYWSSNPTKIVSAHKLEDRDPVRLANTGTEMDNISKCVINEKKGTHSIQHGTHALCMVPNEDNTSQRSSNIIIFNENYDDVVQVTDADRHEIDRRLGYLIDSISESHSTSSDVDTLDIMCNSDVKDSVNFINGLSASIQSLMTAATDYENVTTSITKDRDVTNPYKDAISSTESPNAYKGNKSITVLDNKPPVTQTINLNIENVFNKHTQANTEQAKYIANQGGKIHNSLLHVSKTNVDNKKCGAIPQQDNTKSKLGTESKAKAIGQSINMNQDTKQKDNEIYMNVMSQIKGMTEEKRAYLFKKLKESIEKLNIKIESQMKSKTTEREKDKYDEGEKMCKIKETKQHARDETALKEQNEKNRNKLTKATILKKEVSPSIEVGAITKSTSKFDSDTCTCGANDKVKTAHNVEVVAAKRHENNNCNTEKTHSQETLVDTVDGVETKTTIENSITREILSDMKKAIKNISMVSASEPELNPTLLHGGGDFIKKVDYFMNVKVKVENDDVAITETDHSGSLESAQTQSQHVSKSQENIQNIEDGSGDCIDTDDHQTIDNIKTNSEDAKEDKSRRVMRSRKTTAGKLKIQDDEIAKAQKTNETETCKNTGPSSPCKRQRSATNLIESESSRRRLI